MDVFCCRGRRQTRFIFFFAEFRFRFSWRVVNVVVRFNFMALWREIYNSASRFQSTSSPLYQAYFKASQRYVQDNAVNFLVDKVAARDSNFPPGVGINKLERKSSCQDQDFTGGS